MFSLSTNLNNCSTIFLSCYKLGLSVSAPEERRSREPTHYRGLMRSDRFANNNITGDIYLSRHSTTTSSERLSVRPRVIHAIVSLSARSMAAAHVEKGRPADNENVLCRWRVVCNTLAFSRSHKIHQAHKSRAFDVRSTAQKASANIHEPSFVCSIAWTSRLQTPILKTAIISLEFSL